MTPHKPSLVSFQRIPRFHSQQLGSVIPEQQVETCALRHWVLSPNRAPRKLGGAHLVFPSTNPKKGIVPTIGGLLEE